MSNHGTVVVVEDVIDVDRLGSKIGNLWHEWNMLRRDWLSEKEELRKYIYATDTTKTSNSELPWKNKTTIPKICQVRDNLFANYRLALFPKRKWLSWVPDDKESGDQELAQNIESYIEWAIDRQGFKQEIEKLLYDYIDYGNAFSTVEWFDGRVDVGTRRQAGFVGPRIKRINPLDIVFNPIAPSFDRSPKIIRSLVTLGEIKEQLSRLSTADTTEELEAIWEYILDVRKKFSTFSGETRYKDDIMKVDGFESFHQYLQSDYVEVLTFYGDIFEEETGMFYKNHIITVIDRTKVIGKRPNPSHFGSPPIFHVGWRTRQDNLWAMGPLDNLVGLQYRLDHIENMKADVMDLTVFPPLKIKGYVEDFDWGPFERIYVGDDGDVELMGPDVRALQVNIEIQRIEQLMEEMAGAPKEALGFRTPGEKTAYEVQRLENASSRIFQNKTSQFEEHQVEPQLNGMLELATRHMDSTQIRVFDPEFDVSVFTTLEPHQITGNGRIKPQAASFFAEKAERLQNLSNFFASSLGADPDIKVHFSSVKVAEMIENILDIEDFDIFMPFIRLSEQADAQRLLNVHGEQVAQEATTATGVGEDFDVDQFPIPEEAPVPTEEG